MRLFAFAEGNVGCTDKDANGKPKCANDLAAYLLLKNRESATQTVKVKIFVDDGRVLSTDYLLQPQQRLPVGLHGGALATGANFAVEVYFPRRGYAGLQMRPQDLLRFFDPSFAQYIPPVVECVEEMP